MKRISEFNYNGPSMKPLLKPGDGVIVDKEASPESFRRGDIICFRPQGSPHYIIHRIVEIKPNGFITRGDNNPDRDPYTITPEYGPILVKGIRRGDKTKKVCGGFRGIIIQRKNIFIKYLLRYTRTPLKRILDAIANTGIFYSFKPFDKKLRVSSYLNENKECRILQYGKKQIGRKVNDSQWQIRQPWRLFIDPGKLDSKIN